MVIYNVTVKVDQSIAETWLHWMIHEHGPEMLATECFQSFTVLQLLDVDDTEGLTYAVQYKAETKEDYHRYINQFATDMRQKSFNAWGNRFIAFRTLMQVVH